MSKVSTTIHNLQSCFLKLNMQQPLEDKTPEDRKNYLFLRNFKDQLFDISCNNNHEAIPGLSSLLHILYRALKERRGHGDLLLILNKWSLRKGQGSAFKLHIWFMNQCIIAKDTQPIGSTAVARKLATGGSSWLDDKIQPEANLFLAVNGLHKDLFRHLNHQCWVLNTSMSPFQNKIGLPIVFEILGIECWWTGSLLYSQGSHLLDA